MTGSRLEIIALDHVPHVHAGDDLAALALRSLDVMGLALRSRDVLVVAQKIVSKAEGRKVRLVDVTPSPQAVDLARTTEKDPRLVELILRESRCIVRSRVNVIIAEHRLGFIMANAGIDQSNVGQGAGEEVVLLLPEDSDASAERLRGSITAKAGVDIGVIINDSFGRAWRSGTCGVAIGAAGLPALLDLRGEPDLFGRPLRVSISGFADEIAAAASLVMGQGREGRPIVLVRGLDWRASATRAADLVRPASEDLFR